MESVTIKVQGSSKTHYRVTFEKRGRVLRADCTCDAGQMGTWCKHRRRILAGNTVDVVEGQDMVETVARWFSGSDLETAIRAAEAAEDAMAAAEKLYKTTAKRLSDQIQERLSARSTASPSIPDVSAPLFEAFLAVERAKHQLRVARDRAVAEMIGE